LEASLTNFNRANFARAVVEGTLVSQVAMLDALRACGVSPSRLMLIGGAAKSPAVQSILTQLVDVPVVVPEPEEYVTKGAAMQAISALTGSFPTWPVSMVDLPGATLEVRIGEQHMAARAAMGYDEVVSAPG
jgi:xylulokinase